MKCPMRLYLSITSFINYQAKGLFLKVTLKCSARKAWCLTFQA